MLISSLRLHMLAHLFLFFWPISGQELPGGATPPLPCYGNLQACVEAAGVGELTALHNWINESPQSPIRLHQDSTQTSALEVTAFSLFRELGIAVLSVTLDFVMLCRVSDPSCAAHREFFKQVSSLRTVLEERMQLLVMDYTPDTGVRSAVIRSARHIRSDLDRFTRALLGVVSALGALEISAELIRLIGQRSRTLAYQLGMHTWVRLLAVPGRGTPVFILHDEYHSRLDMFRTLVGNMVRNGQKELSMAEIGIATGTDGDLNMLLREFQGLQYFGVFLDQNDGALQAGNQYRHDLYQRAQDQIKEHGDRAAIHYTSSNTAAAAIPLHALDIAIVDASGSSERIMQDFQWWQARVKPGGILGGYNFDPGSPGGIQAVCNRRFSNDIHLGVGGTFWWYVEPEDE